MTVSPFLRPLGIAAAVLGTLQGLTWMILSIIVMMLYTGAWEPDNSLNVFNSFAHYLFFQSKTFQFYEVLRNLVFTEATIMAFACIYMVASFIWFVSSLTLAWTFLREKYNYIRMFCLCWSSVTGLITLLDIVVVIIIAVDLGNVQSSKEIDYLVKFEVGTVYGTAMAIVARGFILLIVHSVLAYYLYKFTKDQNAPKPSNNRPFLHAYDEPFGNDNINRQSPFKDGINQRPFSYGQPNYQMDDRVSTVPSYPRSVSQEPQRRFVPTDNPIAVPGRQQKPRAPQAPPQRDMRDMRDIREPRDMREPRDYRDPRDYGDPRDYRDPRDRNDKPQIPPPDYDNPRVADLERMPRSALRTKSYY